MAAAGVTCVLGWLPTLPGARLTLVACALVGCAGAGVPAGQRAASAPAPAGDSVWVVVEREATLGSDGVAAEVSRSALYGALADAVAQAGGAIVQSSSVAVRSDSGGSVQDAYVRSLHVEGRGIAIGWTVLSEGWRVRRTAGGAGVATYAIRVRVLVRRERDGPDPAFTASLRLSSPTCVVRGPALTDGEEMQVAVAASADAKWIILSVADDSVSILAPNAIEREVASDAGEWRSVPADSLRAIGLRFRCSLDPSRSASHESIIAVATRASVAPPGAADGAQRKVGLAEFNRWLAGIPPRERSLATAGLEVRKQP